MPHLRVARKDIKSILDLNKDTPNAMPVLGLISSARGMGRPRLSTNNTADARDSPFHRLNQQIHRDSIIVYNVQRR